MHPSQCRHPGVFPLPNPLPDQVTCGECGRVWVKDPDSTYAHGAYLWSDPQ